MISTYASQQPAFRGGGIPAWTPLDLGTKLYAWWDAEDAATLDLAGANVNAWADKKNGLVVSQTTSGSKPVLNPTAMNGRPAVVFDGTDDFLENVGNGVLPTGTASREMWGLFDLTNLGSDAGSRYFFGYGGSAANIFTGLRRTATGGINRASFWVGTGSSSLVPLIGDRDASGIHIWRGRTEPTVSEVNLDNATNSIAGSPNISTGRVRVGCVVDAFSGYVKGSTNSIIVTDLLSAQETESLRVFLNSRGGLA